MKGNFKIAITMGISGFAVFINYVINFLLTPYITENIGIEAFGFVSIAKNTVSYAQIITVALTAFIVRYISVSFHKDQVEEAKSYYSSSVIACISLAGGLFLVVLPIVYKLEYFLIIPEVLRHSVKILFVVTFLNFVLQTVITPLSASAYIKNRLDLIGVLKIISYISDAIVLIVLFRNFEPTVWFVGIGTLISSTVTLLCSVIMTHKLTPELKFSKNLLSFGKVKEMLSNGIWNSLNSLGNVLNSGLDLLVSNLMLSGVSTGQISIAKTIGVMFSTLYQVVFQPFQPILLKAYANEGKDKFFEELTKAMKICGFFSNVAFAGFCALGHLYYELWLPEQDTKLLYLLTVITVVGSLTSGVMQPVYYVYTVTVKNKLPCWVTIAGGVLNVISMYVLIKYTKLGAFAVVITTAIIMITINLFFNPVYAAWCLKIKAILLYKVIFRHLVSAMLMIGSFLFIERTIHPKGWFGLVLSAIIMVAIGAVIHIFVQGKGILQRTGLMKRA